MYCEEKKITTLGTAINHRVLWSGYKVKSMEPLYPSRDVVVKEDGIGNLPIQFQLEKEDNNFNGSDINNTNSEDKLGGHGVGAQEKVDNRDAESVNMYPNQPFWRGRICNLLNDDLTFFGKGKIVVYFLNKPFDEENLRDTDARVLFLLDVDLQITSFRWPLAQ